MSKLLSRAAGSVSFQPLYARTDLRGQPQPIRRVSPAKVPWADVLLDARTPGRQDHPLTDLPDEPLRIWASEAPGWALEAWLRPHETPDRHTGVVQGGGSTTIARFTDPEGFWFAFLISSDDRKAAVGRLSLLLPSARFLFLSSGQDGIHRGEPHPTTVAAQTLRLDGFTRPSNTYSLPVLRDAVRDPAGWFGTPDWMGVDVAGLDPMRVLIAWAGAGAASFAQVEEKARVRMGPVEDAGWQARGFTPGEALLWQEHVGGTRSRQEWALHCKEGGLTPVQAGRWLPLFDGAPLRHVSTGLILQFEEAGWMPEDVTRVSNALPLLEGRVRWSYGPPGTKDIEEVLAWTFTSARRAVAYVEARIQRHEAVADEESGAPTDVEALELLGAFRR